MSVDRFFDTNIILYAYDKCAGEKRELAMQLLEDAFKDPGSIAISVQVLQEFYVNFIRSGQSHESACAIIEDLSYFHVVDNTQKLFGLGLSLKKNFGVSLWDSMILAAATMSGSRDLYSEDLNHGQNYGEVRLVNPFKA